MKQAVIDFAFAAYNAAEKLQVATVEWGFVLYDRGGAVRPGALVVSKERDRVQLYSPDDLVRVAGADAAFDGCYLGDHHAHTFGVNWTSLLPSPEDLAEVSVLYDLWPIAGADFLDVAPRLQVVQTLLCGDVFILEPTRGRPKYASSQEQAVEVDRLALAYKAAFLQADADHGEADLEATPEDFDTFVDAVLAPLNASLGGRAVITFHRNELGRQDP